MSGSRRAGYHWPARPWQPSAAQQRVLDAVAAGASNPAIAQRLGLSPETVKTHVATLLAETGCADRTALAAWWQAQPARPAPRRTRTVVLLLAAAVLAVAAVAVLGGLLVLVLAPNGAHSSTTGRRPPVGSPAALLPTTPAEAATPPLPGASTAPVLPPDQPDPASSPSGTGPVVYVGQLDGGPGLSLTEPLALALDSHDNLYVIDAAPARIVKFDSSGTVLTTWGTPGAGDGQFDFLSHTPGTQGGLTVDASDTVYVIDSSGTVQRFDSDGHFLGRWPGGGRGTGAGQFDMAGGIGRDPQGNLYLTDGSFTSAVNNRVQKFSPQGALLASWGRQGDAPGQFAVPARVAVAPSGEVYVADYYNHRIQVLDAQGHYLRQWGTVGSGPGQFDRPFSVVLDAHGDVYVSDAYQDRVEKFDSQGRYLGEWGSRGSGPGRFNVAAGLAIDAHGDIYVTDMLNLRVQKFRPR